MAYDPYEYFDDMQLKEDVLQLLMTTPKSYMLGIHAIGYDQKTRTKYDNKLAIPEESLEEFKKHDLWDNIKDHVIVIKLIK